MLSSFNPCPPTGPRLFRRWCWEGGRRFSQVDAHGGESVRSNGFPSGRPVTVALPCGLVEGDRREHPLTIGPAAEPGGPWQVETGHDLEAERIALALGGGRVRCLDVVESEVPAIQSFWEHLQRDVLVGIEPYTTPSRKSTVWSVCAPVARCECSSRRWEQAEQAAAHLRDLLHWCRAYGASYSRTAGLVQRLHAATGEAAWVERWPFGGFSHKVERESDLFKLWEAGIHPNLVTRVHDDLGLSDPLNAQAYLHIVTRRLDLGWLRPFVAGGPQAVVWAATTHSPWDARYPDDRREWFDAGLHFNLITALLGSPYSLADVRTLASAIEVSLNAAGHVMADWLATRARPSVAELARVCQLVPHGRQAPTPAALKAVLARTEEGRGEMTVTEVGLVLVAAGTTPGAVALINRGIRGLDYFENWQLSEGRR